MQVSANKQAAEQIFMRKIYCISHIEMMCFMLEVFCTFIILFFWILSIFKGWEFCKWDLICCHVSKIKHRTTVLCEIAITMPLRCIDGSREGSELADFQHSRLECGLAGQPAIRSVTSWSVSCTRSTHAVVQADSQRAAYASMPRAQKLLAVSGD